MAYEQHIHDAQSLAARCAIVTLSDTRTPETDASGQLIRQLLETDGHTVGRYELLPDDPGRLAVLLDQLIAADDVDVIFTNGGTGISRRDQTMAVIENRLTLPLPGFGELFRMLSWQQIGSGAMLSRAAGGVATQKLLFALPGSSKAVELAMTSLILPELRHLLHELRK